MGTLTGYSSAPTYVKIASQTLGSAAASVTFSNVPQEYTDLMLVVNEFNNTATNTSFQFRVGNESIDTGANYGVREIFGTGSSAGSDSEANGTAGYLQGPGIGTSTNIPNSYIMQFMNYSNTTTYKSILVRGGSANQNTVALINSWRSIFPINTIRIFQSLNNMATGSTFTLYGIKAATTEVFGRAKASGGDLITTDGTYVYHTFKTSGTFAPLQSLTVDYLVVAGGGAGGHDQGGGGGAGGLRSATSVSVSSTTTVTVGGGGAATGTPFTKANGSNSVFGSTTSTGGGGAGGYNQNGNSGGSGAGGGGGNTGTGGTGGAGNSGSYSPVEGFAGGSGSSGSTAYTAGGGGGASAVGGNGNASTSGAAGDGGAGSNAFSSWLSTLKIGVGGYLAGGGGGGAYRSVAQTAGSGGLGGGGAGSFVGPAAGVAGFSGITNTGSGGGGGSGNGGAGGNGGSGVVIVRYAI